MPKIKKQVISSMFDVKPVTKTGDLDLDKISSVKRIVKLQVNQANKKTENKNLARGIVCDVKKPDVSDQEALRFRRFLVEEKELSTKKSFNVPIDTTDNNVQNVTVEFSKGTVDYDGNYAGYDIASELEKNRQSFLKTDDRGFCEVDYFQKFKEKTKERRREGREKKENTIVQRIYRLFIPNDSDEQNTIISRVIPEKLSFRTSFFSFAGVSLFIFFIFFSFCLFNKGWSIKGTAMEGGQKAYADLIEAQTELKNKNFNRASLAFQDAHKEFQNISSDMDSFGNVVIETSKYLPYLSKLSSGANLAKAGKNISEIGIKVSEMTGIMDRVKNPLAENNGDEHISFLSIFQETDKKLKDISRLLKNTQSNLEGVNVEDIPKEQQEKFIMVKNKLPQINESFDGFLADSQIFTDILGGNGPRKYLILLQNNQEMRPTGGFIGTYAILDIFNGRVRNFFIDGIFNPDGQLREKIVPPAPIQKISANWSLHDSNWFPNFPTSAEKSIWFYEKTGGPTVDGVITITPVVLGKLLEVTGPIEMPEYGVTVDKENFMEKIQYEVEVDYDKELNQPKKILADLTPKILDNIFNAKNFSDMARTFNILVDSLNEKHILIYSRNYDIQKVLEERGWTGEMLNTQKDYLSVINTNINGFKTDGVIQENVSHVAEIQPDGSIVDTVTITRHHNGGNTNFEWWNKVNSNYMRVYVPKGSQLLSASGQTREFNSPPLDYDALGYKRDPQVKMEEDLMEVDEKSGTKIYEENNKTVFANWVYVSPQETVEIKYTYLLPFRINLDGEKNIDTYSLLAQKQSGSLGSEFHSQVNYPQDYSLVWKYPEENMTEVNSLSEEEHGLMINSDLKTDKFVGAAFSK